MFLGCSLQLFQQVAGINTVMYYSATIITMAGVTNDSAAIWISAGVASVNWLCTFIGLFLVERIGRRTLLLVSLAGVVFALALLAVGFQLADINSPPIDYAETDDFCSRFANCGDCTNNQDCGFCYIPIGNSDAQNGSCVAGNSDYAYNGRCSEFLMSNSTLNQVIHFVIICTLSYFDFKCH